MFQEFIEIEENLIISSEDPPFLVAEIGLNHNNDLELGKRTIEAAAKAGVSAVKFQSYKTDQFINSNSEEARFLFDIFKKYELNEKFHREFQKTALDNGVCFFSTPLDVGSVDLLVDLKVPIIKIASGDIVNSELLDKVAKTKIPIFLSTGAASLSEIIRALEYLKDREVESLCLMHCVSMYPTPYENLNLKTLILFKDLTEGPIGFSDHSAGTIAAPIAIALDASVIEKHFTLDRNLEGPDHSISINPVEMKQIYENINLAFDMKGEKKKIISKQEEESYFFGRRSLYASPDGNLISLRPNLNVKDKSILKAWEFTNFDNKKESNQTGKFKPIRRSDIK